MLGKSFQKTSTSRFTVSADLPGGHQHYLAPQSFSEKLSFWKSALSENGQRLRDKLFGTAAKGNDRKEISGQQVFPDQVQDVVPKESLKKLYDKHWKTIGRGAYGTVSTFRRQAKSGQGEDFVAVKKFHRRPGQTHEAYANRTIAEFRIARKLSHGNVIRVLDLFEDGENELYEMMEFCAGGDLHTLVSSAGSLEVEEANCFFKQLMCGVEYLHEVGLAHRDLKLENLLLTAEGRLKISDFGFSQMLRSPPENTIQLFSGTCGSTPYIAPEAYTDATYDGRPADIWACGIVYIAMRMDRFLWSSAIQEDASYARYVRDRRKEEGYYPIEEFEPLGCRNTLYCVLDPVPERRLTATQFLKSEWGRKIRTCSAASPNREIEGQRVV